MSSILATFDRSEYSIDINTMELKCTHADLSIHKACCSRLNVGSSGYIECDCKGVDEMICNNIECSGITTEDLDNIYERPDGGGSDCE